MKTAKKLALLAIVAIASYASYSFSISTKERDTLKAKADTLLARGSQLSDSQMNELETALNKLETTEKHGRFARENKVKVAEIKGQIAANIALAYAKELKGELTTGTQKAQMDALTNQIDKLTFFNDQWRVYADKQSRDWEGFAIEKKAQIQSLEQQLTDWEGFAIEKKAQIQSLEQQLTDKEETLTQQHTNIAATMGMQSTDITVDDATLKLRGYVQAFHALVTADEEKYNVFSRAIGAPSYGVVAELICGQPQVPIVPLD